MENKTDKYKIGDKPKWIKITTDIFDDEKILMIESLPVADSIIVIWFKLLTFAGKQNNDGVFVMMDRIPYTEEMLASIFRREVTTIRMALNIFNQFGMVEIINGALTVPNWNKYQNLDSYEKRKQRDREYQAKRRAQIKEDMEKSVDESSDRSPYNQSMNSPDIAPLDIDKDKEISNIFIAPASAVQNSKFHHESFEMKSVETLIHSCLENYSKAKVPITNKDKEKWAIEIDRMKRLDNRTEEEITQALSYATTDSFWKGNIRSTKKFREKFETLHFLHR